ncbi:hypothetical protein [Elioraea rosea]|uniref:hypothetical protein n=1 Tax=Elioraea rosea TaxID=2492390 RepID=UPI0011820B3A|nr:hypothetical protein [Elioraea rosea]
MHAIIVQISAWAVSEPGADLVKARERLVETVAREMTSPTPSPDQEWMALPRRMGRAPDIGPIDAATHCFPMTHAGVVPGTGRQFEMDARVCQPPGRQAAAMVMTLQEWTQGDPMAPQRAAAFRATATEIFRSVQIIPVEDLAGVAR